MKILVTGSAGTLGRPLVQQLRLYGHAVHGCDLAHHHDAEYTRVDIGEYRQVRQLLKPQSFDMVYHLAAEFGRNNGEHYYEQLWHSNVIGTRHILELQRELGFKLVFASSSEIYGDGFKGELSEALPEYHALRHLNDYAITKWVNEVQCVNFAERYGSEIMRLRFFNAYGPGERYHDYRSVIALFCYRALKGIPYTVYEDYHRVFMYIGDFIHTLANVPIGFYPGKVINIGGVEYRSVREASDIVLRTVGRDDSIVTYLPAEEHNVRNKKPDVRLAANLLGHQNTVPLEEGIPATIEWMREEYGLTEGGK
jgi:dTDP-glucose 4,6-dehydratase